MITLNKSPDCQTSFLHNNKSQQGFNVQKSASTPGGTYLETDTATVRVREADHKYISQAKWRQTPSRPSFTAAGPKIMQLCQISTDYREAGVLPDLINPWEMTWK